MSNKEGERSLAVLTAVVPFVSTVIAMFFGMLIGGTVGWYAREDHGFTGLGDGSLIELRDACEPIVEAQKTRLSEIRAQISGLEGQVAEREQRVAELRAQLETPDISKAASAELNEAIEKARVEIAEAQLEVASLKRTKDQLVDKLAATRSRLEQTEADLEAEAAIREALQSERSGLIEQAITQRWFRMITEAQLDVCERVGRRKAEACRSAVVRDLKSIRREFVHCLRSNQAMPSVHRLERGQDMPSHTRALDAENKFLSGWYVQLCDPSLPERALPDATARARER
ncbi:MAG: hypothetical protein AAGA48_11920 [Myxococcota bacterium]